MTDQPINPLLAQTARPVSINGKPEAYIRINDVMVACTWDEFVAHLNATNNRPGEYVTQYTEDKPPRRQLAWREQRGSDGWLRERGIVPKDDRHRGNAPIGRYITDHGRIPE